jgi:serine/threonine protein kinase
MHPPISVGTVLQNRYRILKILGQGGFARTYLAHDQRRFDEPCAIKELIPNATGIFSWEKAQELFQQEAELLYQMQHKQIPQFRERFQEDQRLFLVQEYVPGKTYRELLDEGSVFTEQEVLTFLKNLLPVLEHIHSRGIIHRDISPENVIQRESDRLPVLIDFGIVKELATKLQSENETTPPIPVGKPGYSPGEQMQTGRSYPSSDLYALAVTAIVLLTRREPQDLYNQGTAAWKWQQFVTVDPQFARILNKMLNWVPGDRYQRATEVNQALLSLTAPPPPEVSNLQSNLPTVAVAPAPVAPIPSRKSQVAIPEPNTRSILDNPLAVAAISTAVFITAGVGSWVLVSSIQSKRTQETPPPTPQSFPSPVVTQTATPSFSPTPSPTITEAAIYGKRLTFNSSNIANVDGKIKSNEAIQYSFFGQEGEQVSASLLQPGEVTITILSPSREPIDINAREVASYQGTLPFTGKYIIQVTPVTGILETQYNLTVGLQSLPSATPTPIPTPTPTPRKGRTPKPTPSSELPPLKEPIITPIPGNSPTPFIQTTPTPDPTKLQ